MEKAITRHRPIFLRRHIFVVLLLFILFLSSSLSLCPLHINYYTIFPHYTCLLDSHRARATVYPIMQIPRITLFSIRGRSRVCGRDYANRLRRFKHITV